MFALFSLHQPSGSVSEVFKALQRMVTSNCCRSKCLWLSMFPDVLFFSASKYFRVKVQSKRMSHWTLWLPLTSPPKGPGTLSDVRAPPPPGFSFLTWITRLLNLGRLSSSLTAHDFTFCEYYFQCFRNLHRKFEGWFPFFPFLLHLKFWLWFCGISTKPFTASCLWKSLLSCEYGPHFT